MNMKIAPSILSADFAYLGDAVQRCEEGKAEYIHYDVMDGKFVPEISYGEVVLRSLKKVCNLPFDVHLMINDPEKNIESFVKAGADLITIHEEACSDTKGTLELIRSFGIPAAVSVKPGTPVEKVFPYLPLVKMVLLMTVEPGFGGQPYMPVSDERIARLRAEIERQGLDIDIEVDGGINKETILQAQAAGANVFVAGSAVFKGDIVSNIAALKKSLENS